MAERTPGGVPEEERFFIPGTPDEPTLEPSEHYMPYAPPSGKAPQRDDSAIKHDIESALFRDDLVRSYEIEVSVLQGEVTLSGSVDDATECLQAERIASRVPGVRHINNNIQVRT